VEPVAAEGPIQFEPGEGSPALQGVLHSLRSRLRQGGPSRVGQVRSQEALDGFLSGGQDIAVDQDGRSRGRAKLISWEPCPQGYRRPRQIRSGRRSSSCRLKGRCSLPLSRPEASMGRGRISAQIELPALSPACRAWSAGMIKARRLPTRRTTPVIRTVRTSHPTLLRP